MPSHDSPSRTEPGVASAQRPLATLLAVATIASLCMTWSILEGAGGVDFFQFRGVAHLLAAPESEGPIAIYDEPARRALGERFIALSQRPGASNREIAVSQFRSTFETYSTPFLYSVFGLFTSDDYDRDLYGYFALCLLGFVLSVSILCRELEWGRVETMAALIVLTGAFEPLISDLRSANVNCLQLFMVSAFLWIHSLHGFKGRELAGGAVLGLAVMFKPNLAYVVLVLLASWVIARQYRVVVLELVGMATAALFALAISSWRFGSAGIWLDWLGAIGSLPDDIITTALGNFAISSVLYDLTGLDLRSLFAVLPLLLASLVLWRVRGQRSAAFSDDGEFETLPVVALGCMVMLISSKLAWLHYYVLAIPALLVVVRVRRAGAREHLTGQRMLAAIAILCLSGAPLADLQLMGDATHFAAAVCGGAALLFALVLREVGPVFVGHAETRQADAVMTPGTNAPDSLRHTSAT